MRLIDADILKERVGEMIVPEWVHTLVRTLIDDNATIDAVLVRHGEEVRTMDKLKPCPFCSGEAEQDDWRNNEHMFYGTGWIGCRKCRCFINYTGKDRGKEEAIAAWNRRANDEKRDEKTKVL